MTEDRRIAYKREADQSFWNEFASWLSCGLSLINGYQRELTWSCVSQLRKDYGDTEEERRKGARQVKFVNNLPFNRKTPNHCAVAVEEHVATWKRLLAMMNKRKGYNRHGTVSTASPVSSSCRVEEGHS